MPRIIDRRLDGKNKSAVNRQRLMRRYKDHIKKAVSSSVAQRSITNTESGEKISIPSKDISEPQIYHGSGGRREQVHPGNEQFQTGDEIERPKQGQGKGGSEASDSGEGDDEFIFELSKEEYQDLLFDELALPDLVKTKLVKLNATKPVRAGFTSSGIAANLNLVRTMRRAKGRRNAIASPYRRQLQTLEDELQLENDADPPPNMIRIKQLENEIATLRRKINAVPFIDDYDLKFNQFVTRPKPVTQAVMFCIMDVSGSMTQTIKDMAKRFFTLLYLFLDRSYERTEVVFIRHHSEAKEVDEEEFFYSTETGGTVVSSALTLTKEVINERYPSDDWNIYAAQASDGDNWGDDSGHCRELLMSDIMPMLQYFAYVEINTGMADTFYGPMMAYGQAKSLWNEYEKVSAEFDNFSMKKIGAFSEIYPVFHELFKRRDLVA